MQKEELQPRVAQGSSDILMLGMIAAVGSGAAAYHEESRIAYLTGCLKLVRSMPDSSVNIPKIRDLERKVSVQIAELGGLGHHPYLVDDLSESLTAELA